MNEKQLQCFITLAQQLNYTKTAEILFMSQPALSYQINQLEKELGVQLVVRTTKSVQLSESGKQMLPPLKKALAYLQQAHHIADDCRIHDKKVIRIAHFTTSANRYLIKIIDLLHAKYPSIQFQIVYFDYYEIANALLQNKADIAFINKDLCEHYHLRSVRYLENPLYVYMNKANPLASYHALTPQDLIGHTIFIKSLDINQMFAKQIRYIGEHPQDYLLKECKSREEREFLVQLNQGVMFVGFPIQNIPNDMVLIPMTGPQTGISLAWSQSSTFLDSLVDTITKIKPNSE